VEQRQLPCGPAALFYNYGTVNIGKNVFLHTLSVHSGDNCTVGNTGYQSHVFIEKQRIPGTLGRRLLHSPVNLGKILLRKSDISFFKASFSMGG